MYKKEQIMIVPKSFKTLRPFGPMFSSIELPDEITDALIKMTDNLIEDKKTQSMGNVLAGVIDKELKIYKEDMYEAGCDDFLESCVLNYLYECAREKGYDLKNCNITNNINSCWVVSQYENEYNPIHIHSGCNVSAILYLKVPDYKNRRNIESKVDRFDHDGDITFIYSSASEKMLDFTEKGVVQFSAKPGLLLLFPSNLLHTVYPFFGEGERRSISFNAVYTILNSTKDKDPGVSDRRFQVVGNHLIPTDSYYTSKKSKNI